VPLQGTLACFDLRTQGEGGYAQDHEYFGELANI
jgi:hypothetical protein